MNVLKNQITQRVRVFSLTLLLGLSIFTGCSNSSSFTESQKSTPLTIGEEIEVNKGDEVKAANEETEISVRHLLGSDKKYITLISGSAELVRGNFVVGE